MKGKGRGAVETKKKMTIQGEAQMHPYHLMQVNCEYRGRFHRHIHLQIGHRRQKDLQDQSKLHCPMDASNALLSFSF